MDDLFTPYAHTILSTLLASVRLKCANIVLTGNPTSVCACGGDSGLRVRVHVQCIVILRSVCALQLTSSVKLVSCRCNFWNAYSQPPNMVMRVTCIRINTGRSCIFPCDLVDVTCSSMYFFFSLSLAFSN